MKTILLFYYKLVVVLMCVRRAVLNIQKIDEIENNTKELRLIIEKESMVGTTTENYYHVKHSRFQRDLKETNDNRKDDNVEAAADDENNDDHDDDDDDLDQNDVYDDSRKNNQGHEEEESSGPVRETRAIGIHNTYAAGYYDFLINEGSYKFWAVFQLATAALLIYSGFAALYYAKVNPQISDDYDEDYYIRRRRRRRRKRALSRDGNYNPYRLDLDYMTLQRIIDGLAREFY